MFFGWNESICRPATMPMPTIMPRLQLSRLLLIRDLLMSCMFVVHLLMIHYIFVCANPYIYYRSYSFHKSNNFSFFAQNVSFLAFLNLDSTVRRSLAFCDGLGQGCWTLRPPIPRPIDDVRGRNQFWVERQQRKFIQGFKNGIRRSEIERSHPRKLFTSIVVSITFLLAQKFVKKTFYDVLIKFNFNLCHLFPSYITKFILSNLYTFKPTNILIIVHCR